MEIPVRQEIIFEKGVDDLAGRVLLDAIEVFEQAADLFLFQFTFPPAAGFDGLDFRLHDVHPPFHQLVSAPPVCQTPVKKY
jgi:hypothetical protein